MILLDGYIDGNFGDDLMLYLAANGLKEHKLYITSPKLDIAEYTEEKIGFDCYLVRFTGNIPHEPHLYNCHMGRISRMAVFFCRKIRFLS